MPAIVAHVDLLNIDAVQMDRPAADIKKSHNKVCERCLAASRRTNDCELLAGLNGQRHAVGYRAVFRITETYAIEDKLSSDRIQCQTLAFKCVEFWDRV